MKRLFLFLPLIFAAGCQIVPTEEDRALAEQLVWRRGDTLWATEWSTKAPRLPPNRKQS